MGKRVDGRICVIGAGVAGVATAAALASESLDFVVYEKKENLGGLWLNNYPGASGESFLSPRLLFLVCSFSCFVFPN
jgi:cation diffusion facilitator CzcD-associated flavoprotein CzcO